MQRPLDASPYRSGGRSQFEIRPGGFGSRRPVQILAKASPKPRFLVRARAFGASLVLLAPMLRTWDDPVVYVTV